MTTFSARGANHGFDKGLLLVTSAGNSGNSDFPWVGTPGESPGMLTLGAVDADGVAAGFSSQGPTVDGRIKPDVMAQGVAAYVINQNNEIVTNNGTSFSSPITAGAVACLWQAKPEFTNAQIMQLVRESAHLYNNPTDKMGYGIPNFQLALDALLSIEDPISKQFLVYPNPVIDDLTIELLNSSEPTYLKLYNALGVLILQEVMMSSNKILNFSSLPSGFYILNLQTEILNQSLKIVKK